MIKITVEGATTTELSVKLLEIGQLLAAEPVPRAPTKAKREGKPQSGGAEKPPAATSSPASTPAAGGDPDQQARGACPETAGLALESGEFVPAAELNKPAQDSAPVVKLEDVRSFLSGLIKAGKQTEVNGLVQKYAPALSKVPADQLPQLLKEAKALA